MKSVLLLICSVLLAPTAWAGEGGQATDSAAAKALDLQVPTQPAYSYGTTPPPADSRFSAPYDPARRFATAADAPTERTDRCDGKPHGSATVGVGYSSRVGNSNFQAAQLNTCKRYYDDDGNAHQVGVSIGVSQGSFGSGRRGRAW